MGKHEKKRINKMDKILIVLGIAIALYVIAVLAFTWFGHYVPDSLTYCLLGTSTAEGVIMGAIKTTKTKYEKEEKKNVED